jgi:hypothetical protein
MTLSILIILKNPAILSKKRTIKIATKMHKRHKKQPLNLVPFVPLCGY